MVESGDFFRTLGLYASIFRRPLELERFRLHLAFSAGDAAETALFHGWLRLFLNLPRPSRARRKPEIALEPRFLSRPELLPDYDISLSMPAVVFLFRMISVSIRRGAFGKIPEKTGGTMFDQNAFKETILESVKSLVDASIIIGQSIVSGNITIIPVFKASIGIVSAGASAAESPLGGAGGGVSVSPVTFIVIEKDTVKILSAGDTSVIERLVDAIPGAIDKLSGLFSSHSPDHDREGEERGDEK
jgi:uncharacterized spore protein YtfJ